MELERGIALLGSGDYFAAHEELEVAWRNAAPGERDFCQGLVHVAVAWYQAARGNAVGCARQLEKAERRLRPYAPTHGGVDVGALLLQVDAAAAEHATGSLALAPVAVRVVIDHGLLDVGGGDSIYWETVGRRDGKPAVVLHGGPGSGCSPFFGELFDPARYRAVLFDQRNCGRSTPHASDVDVPLDRMTTQALVGDIERLRTHLGIERWLVLGGSWGSTLALAYAEAHPDRVSELVLFAVTTGRRSEFDWTFRGGIARFFPRQWERLLAAIPPGLRDVDPVEAYWRLANDPDPDVRDRAAYEWCLWESATPGWPPTDGLARRFRDPAYRLTFTRIVTHVVRHDGWLGETELLDGANRLGEIPGLLVHGRFDLQAPLENAWSLHTAWPSARLEVVGDAGHVSAAVFDSVRAALDGFALDPLETD